MKNLLKDYGLVKIPFKNYICIVSTRTMASKLKIRKTILIQ